MLYWKEKENACTYFKEDLFFILIVLFPFLIFLLYFILTNTWNNFLENAIFFNTDYYSIYNGEATPISLILNQFATFPKKAWARLLVGIVYLPLVLYVPIDIFTASSFIIFLVWSIVSFFRYKSKAFIYILFIYFCYMRDDFHEVTFIIFCLYFVAEGIIWCFKQMRKKEKGKIQKALAISIILLYSTIYILSIGLSIIDKIDEEIYVTDYGKEYKDIILAVTEETDTIWAVPLKAELYFVTKRMPANGNLFYLPWQSIKPGVNEKIQKDLLEEKPKVIIYHGDEWLWGDTILTSSYCKWLEDILKQYYFSIQGLEKVYFLKEDETEIIKKLLENEIIRREENGEIIYSDASL